MPIVMSVRIIICMDSWLCEMSVFKQQEKEAKYNNEQKQIITIYSVW